MIKSGNFTIIPMGAACAVFEDLEDGTFKIIGDHNLQSQEESLNKMRRAISIMMDNERRQLERHTRSWKMYNAAKEFMAPEEREIADMGWEKFNFEQFKRESEIYSAAYSASMMDITDFMLDKNITIKSVDDDGSDMEVISVDAIKKLLGNLGEKE